MIKGLLVANLRTLWRRGRSLATLLVLGFNSVACGWGTKEHIQLTRIAAERLLADPPTPAAMKSWLHDAAPGLLDQAGEERYLQRARVGPLARGADGLMYWATAPDAAAMIEPVDGKVEPFGVHERLLHFIDIEFFMPDEAKRSYADDLSHKPVLADFPREMSDPRYLRAGMLPFRVEQCYRRMVGKLRAGRVLDAPGQYPRDEHAVRWAGYLAHYVEDNTQPHHATVDYKSQSYFADPLHAPNVHAEIEYRMNDDDLNDFPELRKEFWPLFARALDEVKDPADTDNPWTATLQVSLYGYDALPLIGAAARAAAGGTHGHKLDTAAFFHFRGRCFGREMTVMQMKALQTALAVKRVQRLWLQAWTEAHTAATVPTR